MTVLSQSPGAIRSRRWRARHRVEADLKPAGRRVSYAKHEALVATVERVTARRFGSLDILACDLGYANRDSLLKAYKLAKAALAPSSDPETGRSFGERVSGEERR